MPSSGKVKTKRQLFSYLALAGSECCPMCQLLQTGTNYHITYIWLELVAPILWHYIDSWCLFIKHMSRHLVAKKKLKGICSHTWFLQVVSAAQCVSCSKQEQITTLRTFGWNLLHPSCGIILTDGVIHKTHVTPSSGKKKTKSYLFSFLVLAGSECCSMCQSLQTGTNYHIMLFWLVQVAPSCGIILINGV